MTSTIPTTIGKCAVLGGGVIGAGWVARLIENGHDVAVFDPASDAQAKLDAVLANADRAYAKLTLAQRPAKGAVTRAASVMWRQKATSSPAKPSGRKSAVMK